MNDLPFGFGTPPGGDDPAKRGEGAGAGDPFSALFAGGAMDPSQLGAAFQRLGQLLSWSGGPVNWDLARDVARQSTAASNDRFVGAADRSAVVDAVRLADLWLDEATALPAGTTSAQAWSRAEWVESTLPAWRELVDPVAAKIVDAMGGALGDNVPEEFRGQMAAMAGAMQQMMRSMGGAMFGGQIGSALGSLAAEVLGSTDIGLPLGPAGRAVLIPANVAEFGNGLGLPEDQVRLYLALREAAHHRLYAHVPWLRSRLLATLEDYARGITIDTSRMQEQLRGIDPQNLESLQELLSSRMFEPEQTPQQQRALERLEVLLALIEGWVDEVVDAAASSRLPAAAALRESVRRRRATGGPAEQTFAALVGLELRPRRLREAAVLWRRLAEARGIDGRDAVWAHPDLLPSSEDLADPDGFTAGRADELTDFDMAGLEASGPSGPGESQESGSQAEGALPGTTSDAANSDSHSAVSDGEGSAREGTGRANREGSEGPGDEDGGSGGGPEGASGGAPKTN